MSTVEVIGTLLLVLIAVLLLAAILTGRIQLFGKGATEIEAGTKEKLCDKQGGTCQAACAKGTEAAPVPPGGWIDCVLNCCKTTAPKPAAETTPSAATVPASTGGTQPPVTPSSVPVATTQVTCASKGGLCFTPRGCEIRKGNALEQFDCDAGDICCVPKTTP